jgi:hypothetical protein
MATGKRWREREKRGGGRKRRRRRKKRRRGREGGRKANIPLFLFKGTPPMTQLPPYLLKIASPSNSATAGDQASNLRALAIPDVNSSRVVRLAETLTKTSQSPIQGLAWVESRCSDTMTIPRSTLELSGLKQQEQHRNCSQPGGNRQRHLGMKETGMSTRLEMTLNLEILHLLSWASVSLFL